MPSKPSLASLILAARKKGITIPSNLEAHLQRRYIDACGGSEIALPPPAPSGEMTPNHIPANGTFRQWCECLGRNGLRVDQRPFTLENRPAMWEIFDQIPTTVEEAFGRTLVIQKGAQVGATVFEQLVSLYFAVKFAPCQCLLYLPDRSMASYKSANRFMPIVRSIPSLHYLFTEGASNEGNVLTRIVRSLGSGFLFLWTRGREGGVTESFPGDFLSLDEVQGVTLEQVDRVSERLSASRIRYRLLLSTPLWPELDINAFYLAGDRRKFRTSCGCEGGVVLTDLFAESALHGRGQFPVEVRDAEFVYRCPRCRGWIDDPQVGEWVPEVPDAPYRSYHLSQILSPTISPRELLDAWGRADTVSRRHNFFCRKLGMPYSDPSQVLATTDVLRRCAETGRMLGVRWKDSGVGCLMGVDQMGSFAVVTIVERLPDGRMAVIHVELVYALDPWSRLDDLLVRYGVVVCVVEQLPSIDSSRLFAHRHPGVVWLITSYGDLEEFVAWGDVTVSKSDKKTKEEYRDRWTLRADRFRVMDWAAARLREQFVVFPDPLGLIGEIREAGRSRWGPVLDVFWVHYTKTGLLLREPEQDPTDKSVRQPKREVLKLGLDPHASFSLMAVCLAWFRAFGTSYFILPGSSGGPVDAASDVRERVERDMPGLPPAVIDMIDRPDSGTCGACVAYSDRSCSERHCRVRPEDHGCEWFVRRA